MYFYITPFFPVLNAIPTEEELEELFRELRRVLKAGGVIYIYEFLLTTFEKDVRRYNEFQQEYTTTNSPYGLFKITSGTIIRHFTNTRIEELLNGFVVLWHNSFISESMNKNPCIHDQWIAKTNPN